MDKYGRIWDVVENHEPNENEWFVGQFDSIVVFMNNIEGYILAIESNGTTLKSDI